MTSRREALKLIFIYSGEFAERVIRNLINDPSFCKSCGLYCNSCKYGLYSYVQDILAAVKLPNPSDLPAFIDKPEEYMPRSTPKADVCIAAGLHKDLLLELPLHLKKTGVKALIAPVEDFNEIPVGLRRQVEERCLSLGLETTFPKPFCSLEPSENKPIISRFVEELGVGRPKLEISLARRSGYEIIEYAVVKRSAPCGSTWYIAKKLTGIETKREILYDAIARAHHSYPCTATMNIDPEEKEPILHLGGYIIREEVEKAIEKAKSSKT
ncbi:thymidylate synthase [Candidatus Bathyarchaeota archaeon]|nr:thymidylate synthase [Candidatus Bathyarchaeota archaeon]MBS7613139.1 thymidylate synthase [Candidatus Bathyarchaeota archaeon]MBS7617506.1 thymidylate synthase [Candidatus Bathyarchaeota archaeon]